LRERAIVGDGACQFRAVADQLFGDQEASSQTKINEMPFFSFSPPLLPPQLHREVRHAAVEQLRRGEEEYRDFTAGSFGSYVARMSQPVEWGDNLSLQAIADAFTVEICCFTSYRSNSTIVISPLREKAANRIYLGFYAEFHYSSLVPARP